jgi:hypothetical protein
MSFTNTGVMCVVFVDNKFIDLGNYFTTSNGEDCLITTIDNAKQYSHLVDVPVYIRKAQEK